MRPKSFRRLCILFASILLLCANSLPAQSCPTKTLTTPIGALATPVTLEHNTVLGVDATIGAAVKLDPTSGRVEVDTIDRVPGRNQPVFTAFAQVGTEIVQIQNQAEGLRIGWFDQRLQSTRELNYGEKGLRNPNRRHLISLYRWIVTEGHLVGFGSVSTSSEAQARELGFFDQPLPSSETQAMPPAKLFHPFNLANYYVTGNPFIVAVGNRVIYLELGTTATLYEYDLGLGLPPEPISGMPGESRLLDDPRTGSFGFRDRESLMDFFDSYQGPWGLYQQDGKVFLLNRSGGREEATWSLHHLSIEDGHIDQRIASEPFLLPTKAQQIVLVPSDEPGSWFILEQSGEGENRKFATIQSCTNLTPSDFR